MRTTFDTHGAGGWSEPATTPRVPCLARLALIVIIYAAAFGWEILVAATYAALTGRDARALWARAIGSPQFRLRRLSVYSSELLWLPPVLQSSPIHFNRGRGRLVLNPALGKSHLNFATGLPPREALCALGLFFPALHFAALLSARRQALPHVRSFRLPWKL